MTSSRLLRDLAVVCMCLTAGVGVYGQTGALKGEWRAYGGDTGHTRYAALDQINADQLQQADRRLAVQDRSSRARAPNSCSSRRRSWPTACCTRPPAAGAPSWRSIRKPAKQLWMHSEREGARGAAGPRQLSGRGLAYWTDGKEERILYVTPGYRLVALNAKTGMRVPGVRR